MPTNSNQNNNYSTETQEIMGQMPSWILRWGMTIIFMTFSGVLIGSYLIKYPQIISAPVVISTVNPPSDLITRSSGRIQRIFAKDGQLMSIDEPVAMIENTANYEDIIQVENNLKQFDLNGIEWVKEHFEMGDLQNSFAELQNVCLDYSHYMETDNIPRKKTLIEAQISKYRKYQSQIISQKNDITTDFMFTIKNFQRDSVLFNQKVISSLEYEKSLQTVLQKKNSIASFEASITSNELTILQMEQQAFELDMQYENDVSQYKRQIDEKVQQLKVQINQWRLSYLLSSPIKGRLSFTNFWSENQNIKTGDKFGSIIPLDSMQVIGIMTVPSSGFGKVEIGQTVNIKLNGYPYYEYGMIKGTVTRLSSIPDEDGYIVEVSINNGLQSTYKERLKMIQQMDGTGDIITKDTRLIERFIQPIRALFDK